MSYVDQQTLNPDETTTIRIGVRANFSRRAGPSLPEKIFESAGKSCYANAQNYFARLTPPGSLIISNQTVNDGVALPHSNI